VALETRPFNADDTGAVEAFLARIPVGESTFFKEDINAGGTVERWAADANGTRRTLAWDGDSVVGYAAVIPGLGWSSHVGEIRLVVDPSRRRAGIGHELARKALIDALQAGLAKVVVEVVADQEPAIGLFTAIGFKPEALLANHVRDRSGELHDLLVLAHDVEDVQSALVTTGVVDELSSEGA
jgi:ribosomal protein S18 acetylase RimI-like enzyme